MQVLIAIAVFIAWSCIGGAALSWTPALDRTAKILLAPILGIAAATIVLAGASIAGLAIASSAWLVLALLVAALVRIATRGLGGAREAASIYAILLGGNICTAGLGLLLFGTAWQGYTNGDAAANAMAAEYFIAHPFFSTPSLAGLFAGTDYSTSAVLLNVAGGQRFGDVMLLALSARAFGQLPDQIYMAHGLALYCALLAAAALLVHVRGKSLRLTAITLLVLSASPLATYAYVNQLIGQIGGMGLAFAFAAIFDQFLRAPERARQFVLPTALLAAALCETYPESLPYAGLCALFLLIRHRVAARPPPWAAVAKFAGIVIALVLAFVSVYLPTVIYAVTNILAWGGITQGRTVDVNRDFDYAFVPDFFAYLPGFEFLREALPEPAATVVIVAGALALIATVAFIYRTRQKYPLLVVSVLAAALVFGLFFFRDNGFGAFKTMILMQPPLFAAVGEMVARVIALRRARYLIALAAASVALARGDAAYIARSLAPFGEIAHLAQADVLGQLQRIRARTGEPTILDPSDYLLRKFALLRPGPVPLLPAESFSGRVGTQVFLEMVRRNPFARWLPHMDGVVDALIAFYGRTYEKMTFACESPQNPVTFERPSAASTPGRWDVVFAGPGSVPLNARSDAGRDDLLSLAEQKAGGFITFRASSLGSFYGHRSDGYAGPVALYTTEKDFALPASIVAATGRFALFRILAPPDGDARIALSYSRSPLGGGNARLAPITIYGEHAVRVAMAGGGAFNVTTPPLRPCMVGGDPYVLVDFGAEPSYFDKREPLLYRMLGVRYLPDVRKVSGYLRDLSVLPAHAAREALRAVPDLAQRWSYPAFDAAFDYSGMFEDGWMSDALTLHPRGDAAGKTLTLDFEVPSQFVEQHPATLTVEVDGNVVARQPLVQGPNKVVVYLPGPESTASLSVDSPYTLQAPDGRVVSGLIKGISAR
jgi:hypothetical protein